jgi:hypothetical protein
MIAAPVFKVRTYGNKYAYVLETVGTTADAPEGVRPGPTTDSLPVHHLSVRLARDWFCTLL